MQSHSMLERQLNFRILSFYTHPNLAYSRWPFCYSKHGRKCVHPFRVRTGSHIGLLYNAFLALLRVQMKGKDRDGY